MFKPIDPKPDFPKLEEEVLKFWEENQIFKKSLEQTKEGQPYTFYDGPPFATGTPHYGSILPSVIKDAIPRYQTMNGRFVRRRWGWDCHGLPIEEIVERELKISGKKQIEQLGIKKFNETCRSMVLMYVAEWRKTIRRIARWVDFDNSYKTMDRDYMESVWWAFKSVYEKGLIYEGRKVLLYCPRCETPVSNFEVAMDNSYKTITEESVIVKFQISNNKSQINSKFQIPNSKLYLLAWTTTPWTLPGNAGLYVGEDIIYIKVKQGEEYYILAKELLSQVMKGEHEVVEVLKAKDLVGLEYEPLFDIPEMRSPNSFKVWLGNFVTTDEGTGVVHSAVLHGEEDYEYGLKSDLPIVPLLDEKGKYNDKAPQFLQGQYFKDAEKLIKKNLETRGLLFARDQHQHSYPHCWRCGTTLFYNAIPAWFVNVQKIKPDLLKTNEAQMNWYPGHLKHGRYQKSVEAAPDWNISRNRYWGNPIPVWKCEDGHVNVVGSIKELGLSSNTFYFARHGRCVNNDLRLNDCWPDIKHYPVTEKGISQTESGAEKLKQLGGVDLIFSSDITRCKQTAEIYAKALNAEVKFDERLREVQCGIYNGKTYEEIWKDFSFEDRWTKAPEGGETNVQIQERMLSFIHEINKKYQNKRILVVGHGDPLLILQKYYGSEREYPKYAEPYEMDVSITDLHRPYIDEVVIECRECGKEARRITEIFDSWFEAGSMPFAEYHYPFDQKEVFKSRFPGQFVVEYLPQTRAWFYVMHVMAQILFGKAPFENILTTGTILAEDGQKMSKSKRNYPDPWLMIEKYGVDALRFYLMNSPVMQAEDLNFSERELSVVYRKNILILWNIFNYFVTYANEAGWEPTSPDPSLKGGEVKNSPPFKGGLGGVLDQWIVAKTQELVNEVTDQLDGYNTVKATRAIEGFINELSTWYLRRSRGRKDDDFFATLRHALLVLSKVIAPTMPYMAELIYQSLNRKAEVLSVHLAKWPEKEELTEKQKHVLEDMNFVRELVPIGHMQRKDNNIKLRKPLLKATYYGKYDKKLSHEYELILAEELNVESVEFDGAKKFNDIEFDFTISKELELKGMARELERLVQDLRKKSGLKVGEMANLSYDTEDEELKAAFDLFDTKKTYVKGVERAEGVKGEEHEIDGKKVAISITK